MHASMVWPGAWGPRGGGREGGGALRSWPALGISMSIFAQGPVLKTRAGHHDNLFTTTHPRDHSVTASPHAVKYLKMPGRAAPPTQYSIDREEKPIHHPLSPYGGLGFKESPEENELLPTGISRQQRQARPRVRSTQSYPRSPKPPCVTC